MERWFQGFLYARPEIGNQINNFEEINVFYLLNILSSLEFTYLASYLSPIIHLKYFHVYLSYLFVFHVLQFLQQSDGLWVPIYINE